MPSEEPGAAAPLPRLLVDISDLTSRADARGGAAWKLAEPGRQLDANLVHLPAGRSVDAHCEPDLDVLLLVVAGEGGLGTLEETQPLTEGTMIWLPHGSTRSLSAGENGLYYLTVHRRRPGMGIGGPRG